MDLKEKLRNDCACGAGATLIAAVNTFKEREINYQRDVLFVTQDVDRVVGMMCYIQLSLLGCAGYVVIANTLTNPICGNTLFPEEKEEQEFWYMPFYFSTVWQQRRMIGKVKHLFVQPDLEPEPIKMRGGFLFEFQKGEGHE